MTRIAERTHKLGGETSVRYRGKTLLFTAEPHAIIMHEKNRRTKFAVPWLHVYELGMKLAAQEQRMVRKKL
jgi:hypothetical protein